MCRIRSLTLNSTSPSANSPCPTTSSHQAAGAGGRWRVVPAAIANAAEALTAITRIDSGTAGSSRTAPAASTPAPR